MIEAHNRGTLTITTERTGDIIRASFADDGLGISEDKGRGIQYFLEMAGRPLLPKPFTPDELKAIVR